MTAGKSYTEQAQPEIISPISSRSKDGTAENLVNPAEEKKQTPKVERPAIVQIRKDFRETAFFFPSLVTDSAGDLDVKFTMPESLTKWKILGFAYTKN